MSNLDFKFTIRVDGRTRARCKDPMTAILEWNRALDEDWDSIVTVYCRTKLLCKALPSNFEREEVITYLVPQSEWFNL